MVCEANPMDFKRDLLDVQICSKPAFFDHFADDALYAVQPIPLLIGNVVAQRSRLSVQFIGRRRQRTTTGRDAVSVPFQPVLDLST